MKSADEDIPDTFHILWLHGRCHFIDDGTRKEIETFLASDPGKCDHITVDSLSGEEVCVVGYSVSSIESSSPAIRKRDVAIRKAMDDESGYSPE